MIILGPFLRHVDSMKDENYRVYTLYIFLRKNYCDAIDTRFTTAILASGGEMPV